MAVRLISGRDIMEAFAASFTEHQNTNNELEQLKNEIISLEGEIEDLDSRILTRLRKFKPTKKLFESSEAFNERWLHEHELLSRLDNQDLKEKSELEQKIKALKSQLESIVNSEEMVQPTTNNNRKDF